MSRTPLSLDTPPDVERRQIESWRLMPVAQKAATITALTRAAYTMTLAGIRQRDPGATPRQQYLRLALIVLGPGLACRAYPDAEEETSR